MGSLRSLQGKEFQSDKVQKLLSALEWRVEKLYHRNGRQASRDKAYLEANSILGDLRKELGCSEDHYFENYTD
jgi:hypothetical protein